VWFGRENFVLAFVRYWFQVTGYPDTQPPPTFSSTQRGSTFLGRDMLEGAGTDTPGAGELATKNVSKRELVPVRDFESIWTKEDELTGTCRSSLVRKFVVYNCLKYYPDRPWGPPSLLYWVILGGKAAGA